MVRRCFLACAFLCWASVTLASSAGVPVVYRDEHVTVTAGIVEASLRSLRVGDSLSLYVAVRFDPERVAVAEFDDAFFDRLFAKRPEFRRVGPVAVNEVRDDGSLTLVEANWRFVVVACPDAEVNCPGSRRYELPIAILDYDVMSSGAARPSRRAARFTPWPDSLTLVSAFPARMPEETELADWVPGAAMPIPAEAAETVSGAWLAVSAGMLLVLAGLAGRRPRAARETGKAMQSGTRWERVAGRLNDETLPDDVWLDHARRCLVWYLVDAENSDPFARKPEAQQSEAERLFGETSQLAGIEARGVLRGRIFAAIGLRQDGERST